MRKNKKGLQEATPLTARQEESLNGRGTKASWSRREGDWGREGRTGLDWTGLGESQEVGGSPGSGLAILTEGRRSVGRSVGDGRGSGTVSHDDEWGQEFAQLGGRHGPSLGLAASLPAPGQLGVGGRRELHGGACGRHHERDVLLLVLVLHAILLGQLPVHGHGLVGEECEVPGTAGSAGQKERDVRNPMKATGTKSQCLVYTRSGCERLSPLMKDGYRQSIV